MTGILSTSSGSTHIPGVTATRVRKTHTSSSVSQTLASLPKILKTSLNSEKTQRNRQRQTKRHLHDSNPDEFPDDPSDDSSLLTVSDDDDDPSQPGKSLISLLSPSSKNIFSSILKRFRDADPDSSPTHEPKKRLRDTSDEVKLLPGASTTLGFHRIHYELSNYKVYLPLSLFTNPALRIIANEAFTLPLKKYNPDSTRGKSPYLLDIDAFEKKYGREVDLPHQAWTEAGRNYVRFSGIVGVNGPLGSWASRWDEHFGFFDTREDALDFFPAILELDIRMRKKYNTYPFEFSAELYDREYHDAKIMWLIEKNKPTRASTSGNTSRNTSTSAIGPSRTSLPFHRGSSSDPSSAVCLICCRRGHMVGGCTYREFEDGRPTVAALDGEDLWLLKTKQSICRVWNARGPSCTCLHDSRRLHICSLCGDKGHHAFSWSCRKEPNRK